MKHNVMLASYNESAEYLTFSISVVTDRGILAGTMDEIDFPYYRAYDEYAQLRVTAQANAGDTNGAYAYETAYRDTNVNVRDGEAMMKVLRSIQRKMEKMESVEGSAKSFGQYVNRVARALGIKRVYLRKNGNGHGVSAWTVAEIVWRIDSVTEEYQRTHTEKASWR